MTAAIFSLNRRLSRGTVSQKQGLRLLAATDMWLSESSGGWLTGSELADDLNGALVHLKHHRALAQGVALRCRLQAATGKVCPRQRMVQPAHAAYICAVQWLSTQGMTARLAYRSGRRPSHRLQRQAKAAWQAEPCQMTKSNMDSKTAAHLRQFLYPNMRERAAPVPRKYSWVLPRGSW